MFGAILRKPAVAAPETAAAPLSAFGKRAAFLGVREEHIATVREFFPTLRERLPALLGLLEKRLRTVPGLDPARAGDAAFRDLMAVQATAWQRIYNGVLDGEADEAVSRLGDRLTAIGIDPAWYTAAYSVAFNDMLELAIRSRRGRTDRTVALVQALTLLSATDRGYLVSLQTEKARARAGERMEQLTRLLESEVAAMAGHFTEAAGDLRRIAEATTKSARRTEEGTAATSLGAAGARQSVETASAAAEELSASIREIDRQLSRSRMVADEAIDATKGAGDTIAELAANTGRIENVTRLIGGIASHTRLLALNANIEAARAGAAGLGFTVVANEIKALADQTTRATDDIAAELEAMQDSALRSVEAVRRVDDIIATVHAVTLQIATAVEQQTAATQEIARALEFAARDAGSVSREVAAVAEATSGAGRDAHCLFDAADGLARQCGALTRGIDRLLGEIRSTI